MSINHYASKRNDITVDSLTATVIKKEQVFCNCNNCFIVSEIK